MHLVTEQVWMYHVAQARLDAVALHDLLHSPDSVWPAALRLKQRLILRIGGQVGTQDQRECLREQQVAVFAALLRSLAVTRSQRSGRFLEGRVLRAKQVCEFVVGYPNLRSEAAGGHHAASNAATAF